MLRFDSSSSLGELALKAKDFPDMDEVSLSEPGSSTPYGNSVSVMNACFPVCQPCSLQQHLSSFGMTAESHTSPFLRSSILEDRTPIQDRSSDSKSAMSVDVIVKRQEPEHISDLPWNGEFAHSTVRIGPSNNVGSHRETHPRQEPKTRES